VNKQTVALLLAAWCALVIRACPDRRRTVHRRGRDANVTGPIFIIWIVGYLLQLGVFMAAARKASGNSIVGGYSRRSCRGSRTGRRRSRRGDPRCAHRRGRLRGVVLLAFGA